MSVQFRQIRERFYDFLGKTIGKITEPSPDFTSSITADMKMHIAHSIDHQLTIEVIHSYHLQYHQ